MKNILLTLGCAMALLMGFQANVFAESAEVTLSGTGCCAKCKLKQTDTCQNALKSGDTLYLLEHNAVSKAFHKNLCSGTAAITAVGSVKDVDGKKVLVASKISLAGDEAKSEAPKKKAADAQKFVGTGVCTKCICKITDACQNGIVVKGVLHFIDHNDVSKAYHEKVCQKSTPTVVYGKLTEVAGVKKITATKIEEAPKKEAKAKPAKKKVAASLTIKGTGSCLKCALKKSDSCQNAITTSVNGKEKLYVFAKNECSNGFHKNLCSTTAEIVAVGTLADEGNVFTPTSLKLQEKKTLTGEALCLKCELKKSRTCQNAVRVSVDGKDVIYALDQNKVSRAFHSKVCQSTIKVIAEGTVAEINGKLEFTASKIEAK